MSRRICKRLDEMIIKQFKAMEIINRSEKQSLPLQKGRCRRG